MHRQKRGHARGAKSVIYVLQYPPPPPLRTNLIASLSQPLPARVRQGPRLDSSLGLPLLCLLPRVLCLVPCACGSLHAGHANASLIQCQAQKCQKRTTAREGRGRGEGKDNKKCGSHTYTKNRKLNFRLWQVRGRKRKNCCRNCCRNTQAAHTHTHKQQYKCVPGVCLCLCVCVPGCCNYYERSERTPDTGSASFCIPSSRQTVQTETKYLTTMHPGYSPEGLHN